MIVHEVSGLRGTAPVGLLKTASTRAFQVGAIELSFETGSIPPVVLAEPLLSLSLRADG